MTECKHGYGIEENEIGEKVCFCEEWDSNRNITLGECIGNCEMQEVENE